jgi:neprilysin
LIYPSNPACKNFFDFACGKFVKSTIVHDRYGEQGFSTAVTEKAEENIRRLLEAPVKDNEIRPFKMVKQAYRMCINHDQLDKDHDAPLKDLIERLGSWNLLSKGLNIPERSWEEIYEKILENGFVRDMFMSVYLAKDPADTTKYLVKITPPSVEDYNRGYYDLLPQGINNSLVNAYYTYMKEYAVLVGASEEDAEREMLEVLELEQKMYEVRYSNVG